MTNLPTKRTKTRTVHEWVVETPVDAKTFGFALTHIHGELSMLGVDTRFDDAFHVRAGDDEIVFYVEVESDADPR